MSWLSIDPAPILRREPDPGAPVLQIFAGKPHALAFLAGGALVVGGSRELSLHDPAAPTPPRATLDLGGSVEWMTAHPDGVSVVAAVRSSRGSAVVRVWPAAGRIVRLFSEPSFGFVFTGNLSPDGTQLVWRRNGTPPTLCTVDLETGAQIRELELPPDTNAASTLAARPDGAVYIAGNRTGYLVHLDGRSEEYSIFDTFSAPFFATGGGVLCIDGKRFGPVDGKLEQFPGLRESARGGSIGHDRRHLTFHDPMKHVYVWDTLARSVIFSAAQGGCYGTGAWWRGQSAAAGATHVAAIQHLSATVDIWRIDQPAEPIARLTGYSQGARRLWVHGGSLTTHTLQPVNTHLGVMEIDLQRGAAQMLTRSHVHDMLRTRDGQRLVVLHENDSGGSAATHYDAAGEALEQFPVQKAAGTLALTPGEGTWAVASHTWVDSGDPTFHAQWRAFGAAKWAKTVKGRSYFHAIDLCDSAAAVMIGHELTVVALGKNKPLLTASIADTVRALALSRDGTHVGLACDDQPRLVHVASGVITELKHDIAGTRQWPKCVCFDERGVWLFLGFPSGAITQHRIATGALVATHHAHTDEVRALAWHDGSLWSSGEDGTILRWGELG
ncbi:hypothetical protein OV203_37210 [Nannocystis sp. ILAH1]|uniref:hypothetical protein n=1 Tax=Nannocystis sp. ILAH1 TaxID=2996789 RepID=UPI00226DCF30|nr:hypothetical protein [Nannocystis sp. ILAH1]MCY0992840.1 hypothetical protein [Nannocystis sp. ILAH1]